MKLTPALVLVLSIAACGDAGDPALSETGMGSVVPSASTTIETFAPITTTTLASDTTTVAVPVETTLPTQHVASWGSAELFNEAADAYSETQPDFGGTWMDEELQVLYYAFTGDIPRHREELRAVGLDLDSGFYELREVTHTWADINGAIDAINADWDTLAKEWHVVDMILDLEGDSIGVLIDETSNFDRFDELEAYLTSTYGLTQWVFGRGKAPISTDI